jgi:diaminopimelate epimerase
MNTGSPHYVVISKDIEHLDIVTEARNIRYNDRFREEGTNVDFAEVTIDPIFVRSYERGVEDETLSCGTGVTASALAAAIRVPGRKAPLRVRTRGGELRVYYRQARNSFTDVWLEGEAVFVYSGTIMSK